MAFSTVPMLLVIVFAFVLFLVIRTRQNGNISLAQTRSIVGFILLLTLWTIASIYMGLNQFHNSDELMHRLPLLWQACIPVVLVVLWMFVSKPFLSALKSIVKSIPLFWFPLFQALRITAIGGVIKGIEGTINSDYVFWVGIPDFLFGLSALWVAYLCYRGRINIRFFILWNTFGALLILVPSFVFMPYFMNQPGFEFIFQFPMVLAPSIVVPMFIFVNLLLVWYYLTEKNHLIPSTKS